VLGTSVLSIIISVRRITVTQCVKRDLFIDNCMYLATCNLTYVSGMTVIGFGPLLALTYCSSIAWCSMKMIGRKYEDLSKMTQFPKAII